MSLLGRKLLFVHWVIKMNNKSFILSPFDNKWFDDESMEPWKRDISMVSKIRKNRSSKAIVKVESHQELVVTRLKKNHKTSALQGHICFARHSQWDTRGHGVILWNWGSQEVVDKTSYLGVTDVIKLKKLFLTYWTKNVKSSHLWSIKI